MKNKLLKKLRVLLVEDEENLATLLKGAIGDNFYSFTVAKNGEEGLERFKGMRPDIVITDIMMPKLTGLEMAREIKEIDQNAAIIILSAFSETDKFLNAIDVGVVKYFIKPFDPDELLEYIISISEKIQSKNTLFYNGFYFNATTKNLYKKGRYIPLSKRENQFIQLLVESNQEEINVINDETLKKTLWVDEEVGDDRLRAFIKRVRAKTSKDLIINIRGQGYTINTMQENVDAAV
ncbi:response regulator transcription factor [bacterium]|nr:response regulator transcription factor [bacterium]MBU4024081.1 response regulator transcription factor [bacterium]MBU4109835.1 response regulator transcription factor [bacterium]